MLWGASNQYPQHVFLCRNKKNITRIDPSNLELCNKQVDLFDVE